jgi:hypothetical protein
MTDLSEITELSDAELDAVAGGHALAAGLVNLALNVENVDVLRNADINVDLIDDITIRNVANRNDVSVGAIINVLGGGNAIFQRQL